MDEQLLTGFTANWLWYLDGCAGGVALDASDTPGTLALQLSAHFSKVHVLREQAAALNEATDHLAATGERSSPTQGNIYTPTLGTIAAVQWEDNTFDCVAVHDTFARSDPKAPETLQKLRRIRSLLRPGGWFIAASPNPHYVRRSSRAPHGIPSGVFSRLLVALQFKDVRSLLLTPSVDRPASLIPDAGRTVGAYEKFDSISGLTSWRRRLVVGLGLRRVLYPAYLVMARS